MSRARSWIVPGAVSAVLWVAAAAPMLAQGPMEYSLGGHGGLTLFTEFLEQRADGGERELMANPALSLGGSFSFTRWPLSEIRLGADWTGTDIEFQDDSGDESDELDEEGLADLNLVLLQLAVVRYLVPRDQPIAPYFTLGFDVAVWMLDENAGGEVGAVEETQLRYGATAGFGMLFAVADRVGLKVEVDRATVGNPFDGESAFRVGGDTFDEPSTVGLTRLLAGLTYTL
ncbi:MAG TPA: hypothetical protein VFQ21_00165 [Gemmatimonadota bacterium]|nr:hypothetical protein [Gemmatimonadota bacterium]